MGAGSMATAPAAVLLAKSSWAISPAERMPDDDSERLGSFDQAGVVADGMFDIDIVERVGPRAGVRTGAPAPGPSRRNCCSRTDQSRVATRWHESTGHEWTGRV